MSTIFPSLQQSDYIMGLLWSLIAWTRPAPVGTPQSISCTASDTVSADQGAVAHWTPTTDVNLLRRLQALRPSEPTGFSVFASLPEVREVLRVCAVEHRWRPKDVRRHLQDALRTVRLQRLLPDDPASCCLRAPVTDEVLLPRGREFDWADMSSAVLWDVLLQDATSSR